MKTKFGFIDPGAIMGVVVSLIILAIGVFAFFVVIGNIPNSSPTVFGTSFYPSNGTYAYFNFTGAMFNQLTQLNATGNVSNTGNSVFNIIGVVLIIGAIMSIVGLVYNYVR